jgi:serine/threonine protein kinase
MKIIENSLQKRNTFLNTRRRRSIDTNDKIKKEIAIMKKCCHENIVQLYEVIEDIESQTLYLIMELVEKGSVMNGELTSAPLSIQLARSYFRDALLGIEYCNNNKKKIRSCSSQNQFLLFVAFVHFFFCFFYYIYFLVHLHRILHFDIKPVNKNWHNLKNEMK